MLCNDCVKCAATGKVLFARRSAFHTDVAQTKNTDVTQNPAHKIYLKYLTNCTTEVRIIIPSTIYLKIVSGVRVKISFPT